MSCFFCHSYHHLSQNCEKHASNESRKIIVRSKKCCENCLINVGGKRCSTKKLLCFQCKNISDNEIFLKNTSATKCFLCFSTEHNTVFCPSRFTAPNLFIPNIDKDLIPRFLQLFDPIVQYPMTLSSPKVFNLCPLKPLNIIKAFCVHSGTARFQNKNIVFNDTIYAATVDSKLTNLFDLISSKTVMVKAKMVEINNGCYKFEEFLQLLSPETKVLICNDVHFTIAPDTNVLKRIFEQVPNIEKFEFLRNNINIDGSWLEDLNENKKTLKEFKISISCLNFSAADLANYMRESSVKSILLYLDGLHQISKEKLQNDVTEMLMGHFVKRKKYVSNEPYLFIAQQLLRQELIPIEYFTVV